VFSERRLRLLLVDAEPQAAGRFREMLVRQGYEVTLQSSEELTADPDWWDAFDLVILSDLEANRLAAEPMDAVERYVRNLGGGVILAGGDRMFGEGSLQNTPLGRISPVTAEPEEKVEETVLALILVIDKSSSMNEERRMALAKVAAKQSVQVLAPHDKVGVIAFSDDAEWIAEIAPCSDKTEVLRRIETLEPYGQTHMYPAVQRAVLALQQTDADRRHMILLTDGIPSPGDYREIAGRMAETGITLSTVSISQGAEQDMLKEMARIAGGRHHHCDDPADVPRILVEETREAAGAEGRREFSPFVFRALPGLDVASAPQLLGYARTSPKPEAERLLFAVGGYPLLTWWQYGAGTVMALTADVKGRWTAGWQTWPGYGAFWSRLVRHAARRPKTPPWVVNVDASSRRCRVSIDTVDEDGADVNKAAPTMTLTGPDGAAVSLHPELVAPGRYQAEVPATGLGEYSVTASADGQAEEQRALFLDYPDELRLAVADERLLQGIASATGGRYEPAPAEVFAGDGRTAERLTPLWSYLVLAAMLLFVIDVALRRLRF
jgi:Mg-chelatase subunit ChlD